MSVQRKRIQPDKLFVRGGVEPLYSHVMSVSGTGRMVFIAGQVARDSKGNTVGKGDMRAQMEQVGENIKVCLEAAGASLSDLVQTTTFVTDIDEYFKHPDVRRRYFGSALPTSAAIEVRRLASADLMIEVQSVAIVDS
jgi:enamine deaminase RidA (YjgF/YER057c/UK114 family)